MKTLLRVQSKRKAAPKGQRLKWTPLVQVESVSLSVKSIVGKVVVIDAASKRTGNKDDRRNFLIP